MSEPLLPVLERLGAEIERIAVADVRVRRRRRRTWSRAGRRPTLVLVLAALVLAAAAAALAAATGLLTGAPVKDPPGVRFRSDAGLGTVVGRSVRLSALRVADPAGGPPWGLRTLRTTRALACVQVGRVVEGRFGVLGQDGAFGDDGRFHELPPSVLTHSQCATLDGAGHAFLALSYRGVPASGLDFGCLARPLSRKLPSPPSPTCPAGDERLLLYGLLGPQGSAVGYRDASGREVRVPADGADGAYLVVTRPTAAHPATGTLVPGTTPGSGLTAVHYRDGTTCRIRSARRIGGARRCPAKGYVAPRGTAYTAAQVRATVHAAVSRGLVRMPGTPGGPPGPHQRRVTISFRAPVATPDSRSYYLVSLRIAPGARRASRCMHGMMFGPVLRDVAAGRLVKQVFWLRPGCRAPVTGAVTLHQQRGAPESEFAPAVPGRGDLVVGRYQAGVPS